MTERFYAIRISNEQRMLLERAMTRFADDLNNQRVPDIHASDATTGRGDCIGEEVEAMRDMLAAEALIPEEVGGNDFNA